MATYTFDTSDTGGTGLKYSQASYAECEAAALQGFECGDEYSAARLGTHPRVGQYYWNDKYLVPHWVIYRGYLMFNTGLTLNGRTLLSATLRVYFSEDGSDTDFVFNLAGDNVHEGYAPPGDVVPWTTGLSGLDWDDCPDLIGNANTSEAGTTYLDIPLDDLSYINTNVGSGYRNGRSYFRLYSGREGTDPKGGEDEREDKEYLELYGTEETTETKVQLIVVAEPQVTAVSPATDTWRGGTTISLTGKDLDVGVKCKLGAFDAPNLIVASETAASVLVPWRPAFTGAVDVLVEDSSGNGTALTDAFTFTPESADDGYSSNMNTLLDNIKRIFLLYSADGGALDSTKGRLKKGPVSLEMGLPAGALIPISETYSDWSCSGRYTAHREVRLDLYTKERTAKAARDHAMELGEVVRKICVDHFAWPDGSKVPASYSTRVMDVGYEDIGPYRQGFVALSSCRILAPARETCSVTMAAATDMVEAGTESLEDLIVSSFQSEIGAADFPSLSKVRKWQEGVTPPTKDFPAITVSVDSENIALRWAGQDVWRRSISTYIWSKFFLKEIALEQVLDLVEDAKLLFLKYFTWSGRVEVSHLVDVRYGLVGGKYPVYEAVLTVDALSRDNVSLVSSR